MKKPFIIGLPKVEAAGPILPKSYYHLGNKGRPGGHPKFCSGNKLALKENVSAEGNTKRRSALMRGWATSRRQREGENIVSKVKQRKVVNKELRATEAKDAREIQELIRKHVFHGIEEIFRIIADPTASAVAKISAMHLLLDRAYGKSAQTNINANIDANGQPSDITHKELQERIEAAIKRVESITGGTTEAPEGEERPADVRQYN